ncbi:hypothetical protein HDG33_007313 [Paraburkholderia sp. Cpub6]|nr:hypothetical protein [Paraburkholderia sp. Cpub6]
MTVQHARQSRMRNTEVGRGLGDGQTKLREDVLPERFARMGGLKMREIG